MRKDCAFCGRQIVDYGVSQDDKLVTRGPAVFLGRANRVYTWRCNAPGCLEADRQDYDEWIHKYGTEAEISAFEVNGVIGL